MSLCWPNVATPLTIANLEIDPSIHFYSKQNLSVLGMDCADVFLTEIFLPSYADYQFDDLERKQDPVQDIVVTDEEVANMFPS